MARPFKELEDGYTCCLCFKGFSLLWVCHQYFQKYNKDDKDRSLKIIQDMISVFVDIEDAEELIETLEHLLGVYKDGDELCFK
jgi:hypothetical protein